MKKFLSILIAISLVISMLPVAFADGETGAEKSDITIVYELDYGDTIPNSQSNTTTEYNTFTSEATDGLWEYAANCTNGTKSWEAKGKTAPDASNIKYRTSGIQIRADKNNWFAIKINVPVSGVYDPIASWWAYKTTTKYVSHMNYYIIPCGEGSVSEVLVDSNFTDDNLLGYACHTSPTAGTGQDIHKEESIGVGKYLKAGDYYLVYKPYHTVSTTSESTTTGAVYAFAGTIVLNGGDGSVPVIKAYSADKTEIGVNEVATVTATSEIMSNGVEENSSTSHAYYNFDAAENVTYTYSSEDSCVSVITNEDGTGTVTGISAGTATVTVTATKDGFSSSKSIKINVTATGDEEPEEDAALKTAFTPDDTIDIATAVYTDKVEALPYVDGAKATEGVTATATQLTDGTYQMSTSTTDSGNTFLYWVKGLDSGAKRVVSRAESFVYTPTGGVVNYLIAVYEKNGAKAPKAEFYNANGLLYKMVEGASGTTPELPTMAGYGTANRWVAEDGTAYAGNASITISDTMMLIAEYDDPSKNIAVTTDGSCTTNKPGEKYAYGETVICTPTGNEEGKFYAWTKDGEIVSTDPEKYEFSAWEDCTVKAVYKEDYVPITSVARKIIIDVFGNNNVMVEFIGFDNAVEKGIILDSTKITMTSQKSQFTVELGNATSAKGYAVVKNTNGTYTEYIDGLFTK